MSQIKLTLNKPATRQFFDPILSELKYMRIKLAEDAAYFKPTSQAEQEADPTNCVEIEDRPRGGVQAKIEGSRVKDLLHSLFNPSGLPHFTLERDNDGWIKCIPFEGGLNKVEPDRHIPHLRIWSQQPYPAFQPRAASDPLAASEPPAAASEPAEAEAPPAFILEPGMERTRDMMRNLRNVLEQAERPGITIDRLNELIMRATTLMAAIELVEPPEVRDEREWEEAAPTHVAAEPVKAPEPEPEPVAAQKEEAAPAAKRPRRPKPQPEPEVRAAMMKPLPQVSPQSAPARKSKVDLNPVAPAPARSTRKAGFDVNPKQAQPVPRSAASHRNRRTLAVFGTA